MSHSSTKRKAALGACAGQKCAEPSFDDFSAEGNLHALSVTVENCIVASSSITTAPLPGSDE